MCSQCEEWVWRPTKGMNQCSCGQLQHGFDGKVKGTYVAFWNENTEKYIEYKSPRGMPRD
tara:strand:- start:305 stop:484 length:180 start_codon:yes stop_codon:yes gene_type:complete